MSGTTPKTLQPGVYSTITAGSSAKVTLAPGVYVVTGSVSVSGTAQLSGTGVTVDLECSSYPSQCAAGSQGAALTLSGGAQLTLHGGAVGPGQGFTLLADRNTANQVASSGTAALTVTGSIYAPRAAVSLSGTTPVAVTSGEVVGGSLSTAGGATVNILNPLS